MLKALTIKNIGIITSLSVEFGEGLNILTGETGAGKSMVLSSLNLVLGGRADSDTIRQGVDNAVAEAVFDAMRLKTAVKILEAQGIFSDDGELVVRRTLQKEGKTKALVNGSQLNVSDLKAAGENMVDIHGQHEHQSLLNKDTHLEWLDGYLALEDDRNEASALGADARRVETSLRETIRRQQQSEAQREFLQFKLDELEKAALKENEEVGLESELKRLASAEKLRESGAKIFNDLYDGETNAGGILGEAAKEMDKLKVIDPFFEKFAALFKDLAGQIQEAALEVNSFCTGIEDNPSRMQEVESRLAFIEKLKRKYRADLAGLLMMAAEARKELDNIEFAGEDRIKLEAELAAARKKLQEKAGALHKKRVKGIAGFKKDVAKELADLNMAGARFDVEIMLSEDADGLDLDGKKIKIFPHGFGEFQFLISANEGQEPRPLIKISSGGEISRVMLALKTAIGKVQPVPVLVFDEIDTGIGGKTADMVGEKLKKLSKNCQIICITHLPQIARQADHHYVVEKKSVKGQTTVNIRKLDDDGRVEELARMGAGKTITDAAREHAKELIKK